MHVRICPDCGEEFRPDIVRCSDCGGLLEDRHDDADGERAVDAGPAPEADGEPSHDYLGVFTSTGSDALREAAGRLAAAGVPFKASGSAASFQLLVRPDDYPAAAQALAGLDGAVVLAPELQPSEAREAGPCPACGASLAAGTVECPECQLVLGESGASTLNGGQPDEQ